jgi:SAM-dependent methyltransferase
MNFFAAVSEAAFEAKYRAAADPWHFADSAYERGRYEATLQALTRPRFAKAFEPACSVGVLTQALAVRCDEVDACDIAPSAVARARQRCGGLANVRIEHADIARDMPSGPFELIVFSELGYYFRREALAEIADALVDRMVPGGELVAVHWLGCSDDHILHGDDVHEVLASRLQTRGTWVKGSRHTDFRLDLWRRL